MTTRCKECLAPGCARPVYGHGWCQMHWGRWRRGPARTWGPNQKLELGYYSAHSRIRNTRGPASQFTCVDCDGPATTWSYNRKDANELTCESPYENRGRIALLTYSSDPSFYDPRCRRCHAFFDHPTCENGHEWTEANTRWTNAGGRDCRACAAEDQRLYRQSDKGKAAAARRNKHRYGGEK